jgi:manganese/iron transport system ATP-binding protein
VDATSQEDVQNVLKDLSKAGTAIVLSTHDLALARRAADVVCLLNGRQFAVGTPDDVLTAERLREVYAGQAVDLFDGRTVIVET